jgi:hypothetical protein
MEKESGLLIALGGKPKGKPDESDKGGMTGSSAKKALWKAIKGDDFSAFSEAFDLVCDERDDSYGSDSDDAADESDD